MKKVFLGLALAGVMAFALAPTVQATERLDGSAQITNYGCCWGGGGGWGGGRGGRGQGWGGGGQGGGWGGGGGCWGGW